MKILLSLFTTLLSCLVLQPAHAESQVSPGGADSTRFQAVHFLSLRNLTGDPDPDKKLGDERDRPRGGRCVVSHAPYGLLRMPEAFSRNGFLFVPESRIGLEAVRLVSPDGLWSEFEASLDGQRPMLYLHGYNTSFAKACEQASHFQANLQATGRVLLFSWPSDGALLNYARDEADLFWSVSYLESTLKTLISRFGAGGFDTVGHSLGARGLVYALVLLAHEAHDRLPLVNQVILTAADIDAGVFEQYLPHIRPLARNITIYVSDNDRPLALSREVHGYPRLGEAGAHLDKLEGVQIIDISDVGVRSFSGHLYHLYHDQVGEDLKQLLNQGISADQRTGLTRQAPSRWRLSVP